MGGGDELHELTRELEALARATVGRRPEAAASGATDQPMSTDADPGA